MSEHTQYVRICDKCQKRLVRDAAENIAGEWCAGWYTLYGNEMMKHFCGSECLLTFVRELREAG